MAAPRRIEAIEAHGIDLHALFVRAVDATGKSRYQLADELGVSQAVLSLCYNGKRPVSLDMLCEVATAAGMKVKLELRK